MCNLDFLYFNQNEVIDKNLNLIYYKPLRYIYHFRI